jgi:hypothetical protein
MCVGVCVVPTVVCVWLPCPSEDLALAELEKAEKARQAQSAAAAAAAQEAASLRRSDATLQSLGVLAGTDELGNLERVVLHGAVPAALHSPPQTHEVNLGEWCGGGFGAAGRLHAFSGMFQSNNGRFLSGRRSCDE